MDARKLLPVGRAIALFLGGFTLLNAIGGICNPHFDANIWWIDLRAIPNDASFTFLVVVGILLVWFAIRPRLSTWRWRLTLGAVAIITLIAAINSAMFYVYFARGQFNSGFPIPFSLLLIIAAAIVARSTFVAQSHKMQPPRSRFHTTYFTATFLFCMVLFPIAQMYCFGETDYRRPADAIVVFGARAYVDGTPSEALADRVRTACDLYSKGYASRLIFSGGPGDGTINETESMRRLAISLGIPNTAIICDPTGINTAATVANTVPLLNQLGARRIIVVSHYYHLPRVKLAYERAGIDVYTTPAKQTCVLPQMPLLMARETVGLWAYYFEPLLPKQLRSR